MRRLQTGDKVVVVSGAHKGSQGTVKRVTKDQQRVFIDGVNVVKRHMKPTPQRPGGVIQQEAPLDVSNVMLLDPETNKPTRVRHEIRDGQKVRVAKSGAVIPSAGASS